MEFRPKMLIPVEKIALVDRYTDAGGKQRIKGNGNLKKSQSYPLQFLGFGWLKF